MVCRHNIINYAHKICVYICTHNHSSEFLDWEEQPTQQLAILRVHLHVATVHMQI